MSPKRAGNPVISGLSPPEHNGCVLAVTSQGETAGPIVVDLQ